MLRTFIPVPDVFTVSTNEPLAGIGHSLMPVYAREVLGNHSCFMNRYFSAFCNATARNNPLNVEPAFVVFPVDFTHVQTAVAFANNHHLRICVTGTGSDLLTRHSCENGLLIRTILLKDIEWDLSLGSGKVTLGSGLTFQVCLIIFFLIPVC